MQKPAFLQKTDTHPGILDPVHAAQQFRLTRYVPSPDLAPFVEQHWTIRWDLGADVYVAEVLPSATINLAFMREGARITGITPGKYVYAVQGSGTIVGTMFKPGAFYSFWRQPVAALTGTSIPVSAVFPEADEQFNTTLLALETDAAMIPPVETLLREKRPAYNDTLALIATVMDAIAAMTTDWRVRTLADRVGLSERMLQHIFHTYVGIGVKWVIMRERLQAAIALASAPDRPNWTRIAADLGYSSQSHFVNDFKTIVGTAPTQYRKAIRQGRHGGNPDGGALE